MNSECVLSNFKLTQVSRGQRYDNIAGFLMEFKGTYQQLINIAEKINNTVCAASQIRAHWQEHQAEDEEHHRPDYEARERWWRKCQTLGDGWSRGFGRRSRPWLVNGRDHQCITYLHNCKSPRIAITALWGLCILKSKCQRRDYSHMLSNYA